MIKLATLENRSKWFIINSFIPTLNYIYWSKYRQATFIKLDLFEREKIDIHWKKWHQITVKNDFFGRNQLKANKKGFCYVET